jgi:hypothetical protein
MYVLIHKNRVIVGPMLWNRAMFSVNLERLGKFSTTLPRSEPETPFVIDEDTKIAYATFQYPEFNSRTQYLDGPFWDLSPDVVIGSYQVQDKNIDLIKIELKQILSNERYVKEVSGTTITINDVEYFVSTERSARDAITQKYIGMGDSDTINWKFPQGFVSLTKSQVGQILQAINTKVQEAFDWELTKTQEIESATTLQELNDIVIVTPSMPSEPVENE